MSLSMFFHRNVATTTTKNTTTNQNLPFFDILWILLSPFDSPSNHFGDRISCAGKKESEGGETAEIAIVGLGWHENCQKSDFGDRLKMDFCWVQKSGWSRSNFCTFTVQILPSSTQNTSKMSFWQWQYKLYWNARERCQFFDETCTGKNQFIHE